MKSRRTSKKKRNVSKKKVSKKKVSKKNRKNDRSKKKEQKRSKYSISKKLLMGLTGATLTGAAIKAYKNMNKDHNERIIYEENGLISDTKTSDKRSEVRWENMDKDENIMLRAKNWTQNNKIKDKVPYTMYETYGAFALKSNKLIKNVIDTHQEYFKDLNNNKKDKKQNDTKIPNYFVINAQLPVDNGTYYSVIIIYKLKQYTLDILKNQELNPDLVPGINLFSNFINDYDHYGNKFKGIGSVNETGSLDIGKFGQFVLGRFNKKPVKLYKVTKHYMKNSIYEMDINSNEFDKISYLSDTVPTYYSKTKTLDIDVAFLVEGENKNELPEILIGETKIKGIDLGQMEIEPIMINNPNLVNDMKDMMLRSNPVTVDMGDLYTDHILEILGKLKNDSIIPLRKGEYSDTISKIPKDPRSKADNNKFLMFARYFYYKNLHNPVFELKSDILSYKAYDKVIAKGTCFANDSIFNMYQCKNSSDITTYRFGFGVKNAFENNDVVALLKNTIYEFENNITNKILSIVGGGPLSKKLICICLLTPCNTVKCKTTKLGAKALNKEQYLAFVESEIIDIENKKFNSSGDIFINIPLSNSYDFMYDGHEKTHGPDDFEDLINVSDGEQTFKTIVNISLLYYKKYRNTHTLCYHCKSGKDRTSMCDAIVQATLYYIKHNGFPEIKVNVIYETIKQYTLYFLFYGYIITFYSTGIPGIKIKRMPVTKYVLGKNGDYYFDFFQGNSKLSKS